MRANRVTVVCANCGKDFQIPPCRVWREKSCSSQCKKEARTKANAESRAKRTRACQQCGASFVARQTQIDAGQGRYCSHKCSIHSGLLESGRRKEAREKSAESWRRNFLAGKIKVKRGPENPLWRGGIEAKKERDKSPEGRAARAAITRRYRQNNPDKVREFTQRRQALRGKGARLPRGTVSKLLYLQKWKCAVCATSVKDGFHVDHIYPIAKGGTHTPDNIQILCPTCNVRKNAKHPIVFMQERGKLL